MHKTDFSAEWDARDQLVEQLKKESCLPERVLYVQKDDGGVLGAGILANHGGLVLIDWRGDAYQLKLLREPGLTAEAFEQKSEGFGGVFGFGEKGANGWQLCFSDRGEPVSEVTLLPAITSFADLLSCDDRFLFGTRKPRRLPLWQLKPEESSFCEAVVSLWIRLVQGAGK